MERLMSLIVDGLAVEAISCPVLPFRLLLRARPQTGLSSPNAIYVAYCLLVFRSNIIVVVVQSPCACVPGWDSHPSGQ